MKKKYLFLIFIGGKLDFLNIEVHDIIFCVGNLIEDTYEQIKSKYIDKVKSLHIDSYIKLKYIDGHRIALTKLSSDRLLQADKDIKNLWFINIGGYKKDSLEETHLYY